MAKASDIRVTPSELITELDNRYGWVFDLDAAALKSNAHAPVYFGPDHRKPALRDALANGLFWHEHGHFVWLNCPYSEIPIWLAKVQRELRRARRMQQPLTVVCLLPSSTSTHWWHDHIWNRDAATWHANVMRVDFWPKRINFAPHFTGAKWPSVIVALSTERG